MTKVLLPDWVVQRFDNYGAVLNGGTIESYAANTSTPLVTYSDSAGTLRDNPIELDAAGRATGGIWLTAGVAYKLIVKTPAGLVLDTVNNIIVGESEAEADYDYEVPLNHKGAVGAQEWMAGWLFKRDVTFPVDFAGSGGYVITAPASSYVITVKVNGAVVGTMTIDTDGTYDFATVGGATVECVSGDKLDFYGPDVVGTAAGFVANLIGEVV